MKHRALLFAALGATGLWLATHELFPPFIETALALSENPAPAVAELTLETTIPLGAVKARIDHIAIDLARKRIFVAELGNGSLAVIDLATATVLKRLTGFKEPQGVVYAPKADRLFVANGGDGVVGIYSGDDLTRVGGTELGDDADNIRLDTDGKIVVGYGTGALATLDPTTGARIGEIKLDAHPEAFQIEPDGGRIFVNEPRALRVAVVDKASGKEIARWRAPGAAGNFPMALDAAGQRLYVAYRMPALLAAFDARNGEVVDQVSICHDVDDVFHDQARNRLYVICGEGAIAVLDADAKGLHERTRLQTRGGARTGLFSPELDLLFVAVPARLNENAEIRVYRPH